MLLRRKTPTDDLRTRTDQMIRNLMLGIGSNPITMLEIVSAGPFEWRTNFLREFGPPKFAVDEHVAMLIFRFFCQRVVNQFGAVSLDDAGATASAYLDGYAPPTPPTEKEIEDAWVHEVFSSEDGRRTCYENGPGMAGDMKVIVH